jgi:phospholipid/cholesterol/gamma-HCH transport system substrate-binding protein
VADDRRNYVMVGSFVLAMGVALVVWLAILTGRTGATDRYHIFYGNVMGLAPGSEVLFEGYPVGLIESIAPAAPGEKQRFRVDVSVRRGWPIPSDSEARISASGLLSAVGIDIQSGSSPALLQPGGEIPGGETPNLLEAVSNVAGDIEALLEESVLPLVNSLAEGVPEILNNLAAVTGGLDTTRGELDQLLIQANELLARNQGSLDHSIDDLHHSLEAVARHIDAMSRNLDATSRNLAEFSAQIRRDPSLLLRGRSVEPDAGTGE